MAKRASANFDLMVVGFLIVFLLLAFFAIVLNYAFAEYDDVEMDRNFYGCSDGEVVKLENSTSEILEFCSSACGAGERKWANLKIDAECREVKVPFVKDKKEIAPLCICKESVFSRHVLGYFRG